jgi:copper(I)-binding protein
VNPALRNRRLTTGLLAVAVAVSVSACGASLDAQTYQERNNAESTNAAVGSLALRNVAVKAPRGSEAAYAVGDDAEVVLTVTNADDEEDRLVEVTSSAAQEVVVLAGGQERDMVVPPLGSTGEFVTLELRGLTRALRPGEYVDLTFRFAGNGTTDVLAPVITTGEADRPIYTGERFEGGEEPALQAPAGGHHGEGDHGAGEGEGEEGNEPGAVVGEGEDGEESGSETG